MFTGIITDIGAILAREERGDTRFTIGCSYDPESIDIGASIACSGVCLTLVEKGTDTAGRHWFCVDASAETLSCTTTKQWQVGRKLNLERALKMGDELGGHLVSGHVDGVGSVLARKTSGDSTILTIEIADDLMIYMAEKGSVCVDGVSLTINQTHEQSGKNSLNLNIIPHTLHVTTLGTLAKGDLVNMEVDLIARYVRQMTKHI